MWEQCPLDFGDSGRAIGLYIFQAIKGAHLKVSHDCGVNWQDGFPPNMWPCW